MQNELLRIQKLKKEVHDNFESFFKVCVKVDDDEFKELAIKSFKTNVVEVFDELLNDEELRASVLNDEAMNKLWDEMENKYSVVLWLTLVMVIEFYFYHVINNEQ